MRRKYWINGLLGLWIIVLGFLGFPSYIERILLIITGLAIATVFFSKGVNNYIEEMRDEENQHPR